ncbi:hypothetical protein O6H91_20G001400 [Diphasiastrum complanatum]|uniref:Uncharacterized protein n=1 Tax=Diphasiastrum complanatum TaxID=34168 RepID=A0ACC2ANV0_DIPCM|nr:hypothetical protein O6H91_20G001400 [Diphasiastrum complanatum]
MASQALSSDLLVSTVCSSEIAFSTEASSSMDCKHSLDQVDAGLTSTVGTADKLAMLMQQFVGGIESRVLDAFKQATADVIDHLAKEAATRVVLAERKAVELEQELIHVKQQALAMLLHQKQSTDFQIAETESRCVYERRRAQDAEDKLSTLQESVKRLKGELKRKGDMAETMQKVREQGLCKSSPLDEGEAFRNKECKSEQPKLDLDSLLLFAGVVCDDASKRCSSSMQNLPSTACIPKTQTPFQALSFLSPAHKIVANTTTDTLLRISEQHVQQCNDLQVAENGKACISTHEQPLLINSAAVTSFVKDSSSQLMETQTSKVAEDEQMLLSPKVGIRKSKATFRRCLNGAKQSADQNLNELDQQHIHSLGVQSLNARSVFESSRTDTDDVCKFEVNLSENQAKESSFFVEASSFPRRHTHSILNGNGIVVTNDDQKTYLSSRGAHSLEHDACGLKMDYEKPGACSQKVIVQNRGTPMINVSLQVESNLQFTEEMVGNDSKEHENDCAGESSDYCEETQPKCQGESSLVQMDRISSGGNASCPEESETMEVQQALRCLSEGIEKPGSTSVPFKTFENCAVDGSLFSTSPKMDAGSNISERGVVVDGQKSYDQGETEFCLQKARPNSTEVLQSATEQGQLNGHGKSAKRRKVGHKGLSQNPDISLEEKCIKKPRAPKSATQSGSNYSARADFLHGSSEVKTASSLAVESSRDNRRLMQGARQVKS